MPAQKPQPGDVFGGYRIVRTIGRGAMGTVLEATQLSLNRSVALKLLSAELLDQEQYRRRFQREAETLAQLRSPHIVAVHDAGEIDGWLYIATELISDGDLSSQLRAHGAMGVELALDIVAQVAAGLAVAHGQGVLHRDIKPSNVLVRREKNSLQALLCDLGISQVLTSEHTRTTGIIGTLAYMAPERHEGKDATEASDIYSLGCLLWACLDGSPPYTGTDLHVALSHLRDPIPELEGTHPLTPAINQILQRSMAKNPDDRYTSADELHAALRNASQPAPASAPPAPLAPEPTVRDTGSDAQPTQVHEAPADTATPIEVPAAATAATGDITLLRTPSAAETLSRPPSLKPESAPRLSNGESAPRRLKGAMATAGFVMALTLGFVTWFTASRSDDPAPVAVETQSVPTTRSVTTPSPLSASTPTPRPGQVECWNGTFRRLQNCPARTGMSSIPVLFPRTSALAPTCQKFDSFGAVKAWMCFNSDPACDGFIDDAHFDDFRRCNPQYLQLVDVLNEPTCLGAADSVTSSGSWPNGGTVGIWWTCRGTDFPWGVGTCTNCTRLFIGYKGQRLVFATDPHLEKETLEQLVNRTEGLENDPRLA